MAKGAVLRHHCEGTLESKRIDKDFFPQPHIYCHRGVVRRQPAENRILCK